MTATDAAGPSAAPWAVYVHIPFCLKRCGYCDFATEALQGDARRPGGRVEAYLAALEREIVGAERRPASSVYFGGGTPTTLSAGQLLGILATIESHSGITGGAEVTLEANPTTAEAGKFAALRAGGFNRLSLGVQSFRDDQLAWLGRTHSAAEAIRAYHLARAAGFENISLDLMFGLAGQGLAEWRADLTQAAALGPEHLSIYGLTVEPGTPLERQARDGSARFPGEDLEADMYALAIDFLGSMGYHQYEISNFAVAGRQSEHNQVYWRNEEYRGFGAGAASYVARTRWTNVGRAVSYIAQAGAGEDLAAERETRDEEGERRETMYLGLRRIEGVDSAWFAARYGRRPEEVFGAELTRLTDDGLIERAGGCWRLTRRGVFVANRVFLEFV